MKILINNLFRNGYFSNGVITLLFFHSSILTIFFFYRLILSYVYIDDFIYPELILKSILVGIRLDLIISSFISLPILFTIFIPQINNNRIYQFFISAYSLLIFTFLVVFCSIDLEWFKEFNHHLNLMFIYYSNEGKEGWMLVWEEYNFVVYLIIWIISIFSINKLFKCYKSFANHVKVGFVVNILNFLIVLILTVIFIRGGLQERPLDWGYAHYSNDNMLNETAQNPLFFFGRSFIEMRSEDIYESFLKNHDYNDLQNRYLKIVKENSNQKINIETDIRDNPNVVILIMESFISENCNFLNPNLKENITPFLSRLEKNSISFTSCFSNGRRSAHGLSSILTTYPALPGMPLISQVESSSKNSILHKPMNILSELGYKRIFVYGGDGNFDNLRGFAKTNGFNDFIDWNHTRFSKIKDKTMWGLYDHYVLDEIINIIDEVNDKPFLLTFFSTTNHDPFKIPDDYKKYFYDIKSGSNKKYHKAKRTMAYNDLALKQFFDKIKDKSWFSNTIFILTADHGLTVSRNISAHPRNGHIPFIIHSNMIKSPMKINKIVSQIDIIPTLYDLIGLDSYLNDLYGISGLKDGEGFALRVIDKNLQWLTANRLFSKIMNTNQSNLYRYNDIRSDFNEIDISEKNDEILYNMINYIGNAFYRIKRNRLVKSN